MNNSKVHKRIQDVRNASNPPAALAKRVGMNSVNSSISSTSQKTKQVVSIKVRFLLFLINTYLNF